MWSRACVLVDDTHMKVLWPHKHQITSSRIVTDSVLCCISSNAIGSLPHIERCAISLPFVTALWGLYALELQLIFFGQIRRIIVMDFSHDTFLKTFGRHLSWSDIRKWKWARLNTLCDSCSSSWCSISHKPRWSDGSNCMGDWTWIIAIAHHFLTVLQFNNQPLSTQYNSYNFTSKDML